MQYKKTALYYTGQIVAYLTKNIDLPNTKNIPYPFGFSRLLLKIFHMHKEHKYLVVCSADLPHMDN